MPGIRTIKLSFILILFCSGALAHAQDSTSAEYKDTSSRPIPLRSLYVNGNAFSQAIHLSMEWPVFKKYKGNGRFNFRLAAGPYYWGHFVWGKSFMTNMNYIFGSAKDHVELGLGWAVSFYPNSDFFRFVPLYSVPAVTVGYRYSNPDNWYMYRIGFNFPEGFYLGLGANF